MTGQLTYASFDDGSGRGGWQVKQAVELPVPTEAIVARVVTSLDAGTPVPAFPTAEQRANLPRRILYAPLGPVHGWWCSSPAGADASGRQGNVFTHVVVGEPVARPTELLFSPDWLRPFGPAEVAAATLGRPPRPAPVLPIVRDLLDLGPGWPVGTLAVLADALDARLRGGPIVVLAVGSTYEADAWLAALSVCVSPGTSRRIGFSTLERAAYAAEWSQSGLDVVAVPRADRDVLTGVPGVVVIDPAGDVEVGPPGGSHRTGAGALVAVSPWATLVLDQFGDTSDLAATVAAIDAVAARIGDEDLAPAWPMAMRAAAEDRAGTQDAAAHVLVTSSPERLARHLDLCAAALRVMRGSVSDSAAARWAALGSLAGAPLVARRLAAVLYVEAAALDATWLAQPGTVRLPPGEVCPLLLVPEAIAAVEAGFGSVLALPDVERGRGLIHLLRLMSSVGWIHDPALSAVVSMAARAADINLVAATAGAIAATVGDLDAGTTAAVVEALPPVVAELSRPIGSRVPLVSLKLLGLADGSRLVEPAFLAADGRPTALATDIAVGVLEAAAPSAAPSTAAVARAARWAAAHALLGDTFGEKSAPRLANVLDRQQFAPDEVTGFVSAFGPAVPETWVGRGLLRYPAGRELDDLSRAITTARMFGQRLIELAEIRATYGRLTRSLPTANDSWVVFDALRTYGVTDVSPGLAGALHVGALVGLFRDEMPADSVLAIPVHPVTRARIARYQPPFATAEETLGRVLRYHPDSPGCVLDRRHREWVAAVLVEQSRELAFDAVAVAALAGVPDDDVRNAAVRLGTGQRFLLRWAARVRPLPLAERLSRGVKGWITPRTEIGRGNVPPAATPQPTEDPRKMEQ